MNIDVEYESAEPANSLHNLNGHQIRTSYSDTANELTQLSYKCHKKSLRYNKEDQRWAEADEDEIDV